MRILLVEDDREQLEPLQTALTKKGHIVDGVSRGEKAQWLFSEQDYDLLILDWLLPDTTGVELCDLYRQLGKTAPVIMLTGKSKIEDKIAGLAAGADDYLVKPVDLRELLARVNAMGRRSPAWQGDTINFGELKIELSSMKLIKQNLEIELSLREFQLLEYFLRHQNRILSRQQIEQGLWQWGQEPESNALSVLIRRLRGRLKKVNAESLIETVYGRGYRFKVESAA